MFTLTSLPVDILILVLDPLGVDDLAALSLTCHALHSIVKEFGWFNYLRANPRPSWSLTRITALWPPSIRARYNDMADAAWKRADFITRPLSKMWAGKFTPVMAISSFHLVVGVGSIVHSYAFGVSKACSAPPVMYEGFVSLQEYRDRPRNITAINFVRDDGLDAILDIAFQDGAIERTRLFMSQHKAGGTPKLSFTRTKAIPMPNNDFLESISADGSAILALSSTGYARLSSNYEDPSSANPGSTINLQMRSWVSHLCVQASTPYAAFGVASTTPLNIHSVADGGQLLSHPSAILHTKHGADLSLENLRSSAVYGLSRAPLNSPWGSSPQILVSGWFDGQVRCYDLRSSSRASSEGRRGAGSDGVVEDAPLLRPVLSLADRWSYEPIYSVSCGGGSAAYIAAGTARHSVVSFYDIRSPANSWSVHAPGNDPSPVFSVILEGSRFFGVTESRPFVCDFGPGVSLDTYPPLPQVRGFDNLKQRKGLHPATYHVLRYQHSGAGLCNETRNTFIAE